MWSDVITGRQLTLDMTINQCDMCKQWNVLIINKKKCKNTGEFKTCFYFGRQFKIDTLAC